MNLFGSEEKLENWLSKIPHGKSAAGAQLDEIHTLPLGMGFQVAVIGEVKTAVFSGSKPTYCSSKGTFIFSSPGVLYISTKRDKGKPPYRRVYVSYQVNIHQEHMGIVRDWTVSKPQVVEPAAVPSPA